jgi:hypothetical protein
MHKGELHKLYSSTDITRAVKSKVHEIYGIHRNYGEVRKLYTVSSGISERTLEKCKREWEANVREINRKFMDTFFFCSE